MSKTEFLYDMINIALREHRRQVRKGSGLPYIVHPMEVMSTLIQHGITNEFVLCAAVGHDLYEDARQPRIVRGLIRLNFPPQVDYMINALTIVGSHSPDEKRALIIDQILTSEEEWRPHIMAIKMADRLSNIGSMGGTGWSDHKQKRYATEGITFALNFGAGCPSLAARLTLLANQIIEAIDVIGGEEVIETIDDLQGRN